MNSYIDHEIHLGENPAYWTEMFEHLNKFNNEMQGRN